MKPFVLEIPAHEQESESEELGLIMHELVDDDKHGQPFVVALVAVTVLAGVLLVGIGLYLSIFWGV